jgi:carbonic anhydrase
VRGMYVCILYKNLVTSFAGVVITRLHFLASVDYSLRHLGWEHFIFVGHSMGCEQGTITNDPASHGHYIDAKLLYNMHVI